MAQLPTTAKLCAIGGVLALEVEPCLRLFAHVCVSPLAGSPLCPVRGSWPARVWRSRRLRPGPGTMGVPSRAMGVATSSTLAAPSTAWPVRSATRPTPTARAEQARGPTLSSIEPYEAESAIERLLERSWEGRERRASERELIVDATAGALFVAVALTLLLARGLTGLDVSIAALLIAVYALVESHRVPSRCRVRRADAARARADADDPPARGGPVRRWARAGDRERGRLGFRSGAAPRRVLSAVPDAWHAVGPALVLLLAGSPTIGFGQLPLLAVAFVAGCVVGSGELAGTDTARRCGARARTADSGDRGRLGGRRVPGAAGLPGRRSPRVTSRLAILFVLPLVLFLRGSWRAIAAGASTRPTTG